MRRWVLFSPLGLLVLAAGYLGFQAGQPVSETSIINAYADRYVLEFDGARTDCVARPGEGEVRMVVECARGPEVWVSYAVDARGGLLERRSSEEPGA